MLPAPGFTPCVNPSRLTNLKSVHPDNGRQMPHVPTNTHLLLPGRPLRIPHSPSASHAARARAPSPLGVLLITMLLGLLPPLVPPTPPPSGFDWLPPWGWDPESGDPRDSASSTLPTRLRRRSSSCVDSGRGLDVVGLVSKAANRLCEIVAERKDADQVS